MSRIVGGNNIAIKIPRSHFDKMLAFYTDVLGLELNKEEGFSTESYSTKFGDFTLWLDCVEAIGKSDIWLEATTKDLNNTIAKIKNSTGSLRPEIETLPPRMNAVWICDPCGNTLLLKEDRTN